jgi:hypothetical protein
VIAGDACAVAVAGAGVLDGVATAGVTVGAICVAGGKSLQPLTSRERRASDLTMSAMGH